MTEHAERISRIKEICIEDFEDSIRRRGNIDESGKEYLIDDIFQAVDEAFSLVKEAAEEGSYDSI